MRAKISVLVSSLLLFTSFMSFAHAAQAPKEWTFLVFLNGNNNLDQFGTTNINQMEKAGGSNDHVNMVVEWASEGARTNERLLIQAGPGAGTVTSPVVQTLGQVDMGDYNSLIDFIKWGVENYPAQHYLVDVWDHGSGWHGIEAMDLAQSIIGGGSIFHTNDISWDEISGNHMTTKQLATAIAAGAQAIGHKIDVYGSDACLMGMVEIATEMKDTVSYYVGSQEVEAGLGWPYDTILSAWGNVSRSPRDVATIIAQEYVKSYEGGSNGTNNATMAAYDLSQLPALEQAVADFAASIQKLSASDLQKLNQAAASAQAFTDDDYKDLLDFLSKADASGIAGLDRTTMSTVAAAASRVIVTAGATSAFPGAHGLNIWLPNSTSEYSQYSQDYATMNFDVATGWSNALQAILGASSAR